MNNATIVAILTAAKELVWNGIGCHYENGTQKFVCIAVDCAAREAGINLYGVEVATIKQRITSYMEGAFIFEDFYGKKHGIGLAGDAIKLGYEPIQAARQVMLDDLIAEYEDKRAVAKAKAKTLSAAAERWETQAGSAYVCDNVRHICNDFGIVDRVREDIKEYIGGKFCIVEWMTGDDRGLPQRDNRVIAERRKMIATLLARYEAEAA